MQCKICAQPSNFFTHSILLNKYNVHYYRCSYCCFIQTEEPYWLDEAYSDAITKSDIGLAGRSVASARMTQAIIELLLDGRKAFLDYGGGYGLMVRLMRDAGFNYYRDDKYCANLFAQGFDVDNYIGSVNDFEALTAFEVFEHLIDPPEEVAKMLNYSQTLIFTTTLLPEPTPHPDQWWYFGPEHGQHVSLYTRKALSILGGQFGLRLYSDNRSLHMLTNRRLSEKAFRYAARYSTLLAPALTFIKRRGSLLPQDFYTLTGRSLT